MRVENFNQRVMDIETYSNISRILGKLQGMACGFEDDKKAQACLFNVYNDLRKVIDAQECEE